MFPADEPTRTTVDSWMTVMQLSYFSSGSLSSLDEA